MWKPIPLFDGLYEVSIDGTTVRRTRAGHGVSAGKVLSVNWDNGYAKVKLCDGKRYLVHRLVLMAYDRIPADDELSLHKDGDRTNNHADNLYWGSPSENNRDAVAHGTCSFLGDRNPNNKLTVDDVVAIKQRLSRGDTLRSIAQDYGVNHSSISAIKSGKTWSYIDG